MLSARTQPLPDQAAGENHLASLTRHPPSWVVDVPSLRLEALSLRYRSLCYRHTSEKRAFKMDLRA